MINNSIITRFRKLSDWHYLKRDLAKPEAGRNTPKVPVIKS